MAGRKKLQDYYIDRKVPRRERDAAPVIAHGGEVLWTPFGPPVASGPGGMFEVRWERRPAGGGSVGSVTPSVYFAGGGPPTWY